MKSIPPPRKNDHAATSRRKTPLMMLRIVMAPVLPSGDVVQTETFCAGEGSQKQVLAAWSKARPTLAASVKSVEQITPHPDKARRQVLLGRSSVRA